MNDWPHEENEVLRNRVKELTQIVKDISKEADKCRGSQYTDDYLTAMENIIDIIDEQGIKEKQC